MSITFHDRRQFLRDLGVSAAALPFLAGLSSARGEEQTHTPRAKRLVIVFTPNGTLPNEFWPAEFRNPKKGKKNKSEQKTKTEVPLSFGPILSALQPFRDQTLMLKGVHNMIRGDGDGHMRGMSCLLTAIELNPGNIQGGSDKPAGWASGLSIDQEIRNHFQTHPESHTRFGSLEFGVAVPNRADPWTRMCYAGNNQPVAPIDNPGQMFDKLYGSSKGRERVASVIDFVRDDLRKTSKQLSSEDKTLLEEHMQIVHQLEQDIASANNQTELVHPEPEIDPEIELVNDNTPKVSRMQIDLLVNALANNMTRVASLQFMRSVGQARMRWLEIDEGHHSLSHEPDNNKDAQTKLRRINKWFTEEIAYLAGRLQATPEPGSPSETMLDNTQIVCVNELGKGNNHTLNDIPFVLIGGGAGFKTGRALDLEGVPHNRLWLSLAHGLGHSQLETFGAERFCSEGDLQLF